MRRSLLPLALIASLGFGTVQAARLMHPTAHRVSAPAPPRYLVLLVLDGGRPDYFGLTRLPHIDALLSRGMQFTNTIDGILESETPSGHTTLSTGSTPRRDGILGFDWAQNDNDYSLFSPATVRSGAMERIMLNAHVPTIAGLYKARYPKARVVALSGHKYYAADPLGGPSADVIMYYQGDARGRYVPVAIPGHTPPATVLSNPALIFKSTQLPLGTDDSAATDLALATFGVLHQRLTLINYPEFDWPLGHVDGGAASRPQAAHLMQVLDADLGRIESALRKRHVLNKTLFVITADHGMGSVSRFVPWSVISNAVARAKTSTTSTSYNGAAYVWLKDYARSGTVARNIATAHDPGVQSVYYLTGSGRQQRYVEAGSTVGTATDAANRYLLGTLMNGHQPDVVAFSRAHSTFSGSNTHWKGDHGGAQWTSQHIPLIIAGPGVRHGVDGQAAQLDDVAPTLLQAMGVRPTGMEGHVLTEALQGAPQDEQRERATEIKQVQPVVAALLAQRAWELHHP